MVRRRRLLAAGVTHHVIQRGNDRQPVFFSDDDRLLYLNWLGAAAARHGAGLHAYVLMTNHVHLLLTAEREGTLPRIMQSLGRRYVAHINEAYRRTGTLWEGRYRSTILDSETYVAACYCYIEANPLRARMVAQAGDYPWSSFRCNGLGAPDPLVTHHGVYSALGATAAARQTAYRKLFDDGLKADTLKTIREATQQGWVPGRDRFRAEIEAATGRTTTPPRRGRPPKASHEDDNVQPHML